jgi:hypothetical protein
VRSLTILVGLFAASIAGGAGCTLDEGRPPLARIEITPPSIVENDGFQTTVTLDGTASADPLDDPDGSSRLTFAWEILDDEHRFEGSRASSPVAMVLLRGDRPATIVLTVTDGDDLEATAVGHVQLTVR